MTKLLFGLIGYPLSHSYSPSWFHEKFLREGIDAIYQAFPLQSIDEFPAWLLQHPDISGLNVTIPHKTAVIPFLDHLDESAKAIGAVNCIAFENGKRMGYNTDWCGFRDSLQPLLTIHHKKALILGSGGAAKAVAYALQQLGIPFKVVSRGQPDGPFLDYDAITPALLKEFRLIINTTPLGMAPQENSKPEIPYHSLTDRHLLYDLIYNPAETEFLKLGKANGAAIKNGLEMLHLQAEASWKIWKVLKG